MTIQLELYQVFLLMAAIGVASGALSISIGRQIDAKFAAITKHLGEQDKRLTALEKQFTDLRVELARDYVHNDDYVRDFGRLANRFEALLIAVEKALAENLEQLIAAIKEARR